MTVQQGLQQWLELACDTARQAGELLKAGTEEMRAVNFTSAHDVKIEADIRSERLIMDILRQNSPFSILSEEFGFEERDDKQRLWIVDPVDGSLNYTRQMPLCCVSIGLWEGDQPLLGVIYDFSHDELFTGIVGEGSWLNGEPIHVSKVTYKRDAVMTSGFPNKADYSVEGVQRMITDIQEYRKVRFLGTAALSIAYVACGRCEAYYERSIMLWDIAGGIPIVLGAGGQAHTQPADLKHSFNVQVANTNLE